MATTLHHFSFSSMAGIWCLLALAFAMAAVRIHSQSTDTLDFISIDCGINDGFTYIDPATNISYVSDAQYTDSGINANISGAYVTNGMGKRYLNVRSFPNGTRNCYTIKPITPGSKYLVRATFLYGNYDGSGSPSLLFDLHLGVNHWKTVNITDPGFPFRTDAITVAAADFLSVCLVNTGQGTPFVSGIDVRPLKSILYPAANASRSLVLLKRLNMGPTDTYIRYPDDPHDRIWEPFNHIPFWAEISTNSTVENLVDDKFEAPSAVMQTAVVPVNSTKLMLQWVPDPGDVNEFYAVMHFSEFLALAGSNLSRQFWVYLNDEPWYPKPFTPDYLISDAIFGTNPTKGYREYNVTVQALANSTLPPILNAMEVYSRMSDDNSPSDAGDVNAMMMIKSWYEIKKNWMGDPCAPKDFVWDGVNCTFSISDTPRITTLNLSSSGLNGGITPSFASLSAIQFLDLSNNNLTGGIPAILAELPSLKLLDLTNNSLNGSIPSALLTKAQSGSLTLRTEKNGLLCASGSSCQVTATTSSKKKISTPVIVVLCVVLPLLVLLVVFILCRLRRSRGQRIGKTMDPPNQDFLRQGELQNGSLQLENRQFTYMELKSITSNFQKVIGKGGFGIVYHGHLEDGTQVAVKLRSQSSEQGTKEFLAEAQHLTRVHHKNLVSMVGYCNDGEYLALVYEYMAQGTLQDHLRGRAPHARPLSWGQRLRIVVEAAQGLEYLHKACKPALIHRDVKTGNILLSQTLEAKIADFGLSKAFQGDLTDHVSTAVVGTPGYLDPEYYNSYQLSEKSDVFSFGVVLLELITGQPPVISAAGKAHIVQWVRQRLARGNIEDIVDPRLRGEYDVNSVWKCADVALKCTAHSSQQRPFMAEVVVQLKESLELEKPAVASENLYSDVSDVSQNSALEIDRVARMSVGGGPSAR
ncbi:putative LRR receptor-like serine/threonine-protein kinase [Canna indica]|uniref:non-specific serine/threonine protein kinase n=1 Tax=Canna indica TaxID=4628 RepID=A0AAQ3K383_9LILI|nr:putative LRR receptor-like serine/threonine-protein kinase [Canna indica]